MDKSKKRITIPKPKYKGILHSPKENPNRAWIVALLMPVNPKYQTQVTFSVMKFASTYDGFEPVSCKFNEHGEDMVMVAWCYKRDLLKLLSFQPKQMYNRAKMDAFWTNFL